MEKTIEKPDYVPFGPEWESYMMTLRKIDIIDLIRKQGSEKQLYLEKLESELTSKDKVLAEAREALHTAHQNTMELYRECDDDQRQEELRTDMKNFLEAIASIDLSLKQK